MKTFPEIMIGKPASQWKRFDLWTFRFFMAFLGGLLWLLMAVSVVSLHSKINLLWVPLGFVGWVFMVFIFILTWIRLPIKVTKITSVQEPIPTKRNLPLRQKVKRLFSRKKK